MKVLWLTETPSRYKAEEAGYNGRGWISSLQLLVESCPEIDHLGIVFPHSTDSKQLTFKKLTYFPIKKGMPGNIISWIISNWNGKIEHTEEINQLKLILKDFKPDVIHIFGTESWLCHVVNMTDKPCVVHLQGLLQPCVNAFIPTGISKYDLMKYDWIHFLKGISLWHQLRIVDRKSKREYLFFKDIRFFMGRTLWDKSISGFLSSRSTYFHVDEVLRDQFYSANPWKYHSSSRVLITSTLSDNLYKGLDLVIKTASILAKERFEFEWRVVGVDNESKSALLLKRIFPQAYTSIGINLLGIKNTDEIIGLLSESSLYVHTSNIDNSPNSLCEAQLMGVPVIATNVGGISSLIEDGENGFLVPANDPYFLAARIVQLHNNKMVLENISKRGREKAQKRHSPESILNQLVQTYRILAVSHPKTNSNVKLQSTSN